MATESPISVPSVAAGAYVALLGYAGGTYIGVDSGSVLVACVIGGLVVTLALERRPDVWAALGRRRLLPVPLIAPSVPALVLTADLEVEWLPTPSLTSLGWVFALVVVSVVIWAYGTSKYAELAAGGRVASWTATPDPTRRRRRKLFVVLGALGSVGYFVVGLAYGLPSFVAGLLISATVGQWINHDRLRRYDVRDGGLRYGLGSASDARQFVPWTRFERVIDTPDAVVLERRWWFDVRMDADEVPPSAREALQTSINVPYHRWDH